MILDVFAQHCAGLLFDLVSFLLIRLFISVNTYFINKTSFIVFILAVFGTIPYLWLPHWQLAEGLIPVIVQLDTTAFPFS